MASSTSVLFAPSTSIYRAFKPSTDSQNTQLTILNTRFTSLHLAMSKYTLVVTLSQARLPLLRADKAMICVGRMMDGSGQGVKGFSTVSRATSNYSLSFSHFLPIFTDEIFLPDPMHVNKFSWTDSYNIRAAGMEHEPGTIVEFGPATPIEFKQEMRLTNIGDNQVSLHFHGLFHCTLLSVFSTC